MDNTAEFETEHKLEFEVAPWIPIGDSTPDKEFMKFRVGTCNGLYRSTPESYNILAITNNNKGNGHLTDVLQWFEQSCIRDKRVLRVLEVWNKKFKKHLIEKHSFVDIGKDNIEKNYFALITK